MSDANYDDFGEPDDPGDGDAYCDECGFDHLTEDYSAREWHEQNPCTYCVYEYGFGHGPNCPTQYEQDDE